MLDSWSQADLAFSTGKSSSANAARCTLLGLPVEIRTMILRMVVGDQRVHAPKKYRKGVRGQFGFELFAVNRQLWGEAFPLFWRTSRICFNKGYEWERCLDRLTEYQTSNLRHLALERTKRNWPSCYLKNVGTHPLRFLESLKLRLTL